MQMAYIFAGIGALMAFIGLCLIIKPLVLLAAGARGQGVITDVDRDSGEFPIVTFVPNEGGEQVRFRSNVSAGTVEVGTVVPVLYPTSAPKRAIIGTFAQMWLVPIILFSMAAICGVVAIGLALFA
jgi:hypothetical protein